MGEVTRAVTVRAGATEAVELAAASGVVVAAAPEPSAPPSLTPEIPRGPAADTAPTTLVAAPPGYDEGPTPWYGRWWVWTGAAVLVAGGVTAAVHEASSANETATRVPNSAASSVARVVSTS